MYDYNYYDYGYNYSYDTADTVGGIFALGAVSWIVTIAISVLTIISLWKIFVKCGKEGWIALIPFYNMWVLFEITGSYGWLCLIPFANIVFLYISYYKLAIKLNKGAGFGVLTIFFPFVCLPILAFSKSAVVAEEQYSQPVYQQPINPQPVNMQPQQVNAQSQQTVSSEGFKFCTSCGTKAFKNQKFCDNCGKEFDQ